MDTANVAAAQTTTTVNTEIMDDFMARCIARVLDAVHQLQTEFMQTG
jgi:hypothetical protein